MARSMPGHRHRQQMIVRPVSSANWGQEWPKIRQSWLCEEILNGVLPNHDLAQVSKCSPPVRGKKTVVKSRTKALMRLDMLHRMES